jgi:hypothetical protein
VLGPVSPVDEVSEVSEESVRRVGVSVRDEVSRVYVKRT